MGPLGLSVEPSSFYSLELPVVKAPISLVACWEVGVDADRVWCTHWPFSEAGESLEMCVLGVSIHYSTPFQNAIQLCALVRKGECHLNNGEHRRWGRLGTW